MTIRQIHELHKRAINIDTGLINVAFDVNDVKYTILDYELKEMEEIELLVKKDYCFLSQNDNGAKKEILKDLFEYQKRVESWNEL